MANIDTELTTISEAIYGRDMRGALHDAIQKVNNDVSTLVSETYTTSNDNFSIAAQFDKVGSVVTFHIDIHATTSFSSDDVALFTIPSNFIPAMTDLGSHPRKFTIAPCPFDDSGTTPIPYVTIANSLFGGHQFKAINFSSANFGWITDVMVNGSYITAAPAST